MRRTPKTTMPDGEPGGRQRGIREEDEAADLAAARDREHPRVAPGVGAAPLPCGEAGLASIKTLVSNNSITVSPNATRPSLPQTSKGFAQSPEARRFGSFEAFALAH